VTRKIGDFLTPSEVKAFTQASDLRGALSVATSWGIVALAFALVTWLPHPLTVIVALVLLGGRHLGLAILMHEAAHRSLFRTRALNDFVGEWLCAAPTWQHLALYRRHHLAHHAHDGRPGDPDIGLVRGYPIARTSLLRKFARDLVGITAARRVVALVLMDAEVIGYTASTDPTPLDQTGRRFVDKLGAFVRNFFPVALTNTALCAVLCVIGHPFLYLLWLAAYGTTFSVFVRLRSLAEHACVPEPGDPFAGTRTTRARVLARLTCAPHHVNYHLEHHLLMTVPHHRLPELHRVLRDRGALSGSPLASGYLQVLREVTRI
jgi:fatty acid desaturase